MKGESGENQLVNNYEGDHGKSMSDTTPKELLRVAAFPLIVLALLFGFIAAYQFLGLPNSAELVKICESYLGRYGYMIVFIAAFVETIPPINFYLPGSTVVVLSAAFARHGTLNIFAVLGVAGSAFLLAYILDYLIGRWGWHWVMLRCGLGPSLERSRQKVSVRGPSWLWWAYVHPNIGAIAATSCGILRIPFKAFMLHSVGALAVWVSLWGAGAFFIGDRMVKYLDIRWLIPLAFLWLALTLRKRFHYRRQKPKP